MKGSDFIFIALPTDLNEKTGRLDTRAIEKTVGELTAITPESYIIIKSTVPVGFTESLKERTGSDKILFMPEFLREGKGYLDMLSPSRVIIGGDSSSDDNKKIISELKRLFKTENDSKILVTSTTEAETIKLFSNTYLANRVAFFNEIDSFCFKKGLDPELVVKGISLDERIGEFYNNPSFGFGGYCLPKDSTEVIRTLEDMESPLIKSITLSNRKRKEFIAEEIENLTENGEIIGIYKLDDKADSRSISYPAVEEIVEILKDHGKSVIIYEPALEKDHYFGFEVTHDKNQFFDKADVLVANRKDQLQKDLRAYQKMQAENSKAEKEFKLFTRDLTGKN